MLTCNSADFRKAAAEMPWHAGVVIVPNDNDADALAKLAKRVDEAIRHRSLTGQVVDCRGAPEPRPKLRKKRGG